MDLSKTKLVVLSACETARGDVFDGEGVFGLQRALKKAGAESLLLSLWKIPDEATVKLMKLFYLAYLTGKSPSNSLKKAQQQLRKEYPSPYYWASFKLIH
ncbi:MAG: CHAT domain-containing protein [Bacteroidota bacterium]